MLRFSTPCEAHTFTTCVCRSGSILRFVCHKCHTVTERSARPGVGRGADGWRRLAATQTPRAAEFVFTARSPETTCPVEFPRSCIRAPFLDGVCSAGRISHANTSPTPCPLVPRAHLDDCRGRGDTRRRLGGQSAAPTPRVRGGTAPSSLILSAALHPPPRRRGEIRLSPTAEHSAFPRARFRAAREWRAIRQLYPGNADASPAACALEKAEPPDHPSDQKKINALVTHVEFSANPWASAVSIELNNDLIRRPLRELKIIPKIEHRCSAL